MYLPPAQLSNGPWELTRLKAVEEANLLTGMPEGDQLMLDRHCRIGEWWGPSARATLLTFIGAQGPISWSKLRFGVSLQADHGRIRGSVRSHGTSV